LENFWPNFGKSCHITKLERLATENHRRLFYLFIRFQEDEVL
jgi:hypothetical protein